MTSLPPLNALRAFEAATRHRSFSKAADELCVTHSAISHQIKQLEEWFGSALFLRTSQGVVPTSASAEFHQAVRECLSRLSDASEQFKRVGNSKCLTVAVIPSVATRWVIPRLPKFQIENPDIDLVVMYTPPKFEGEISGCDLLITYFDGEYSGHLDAKILFSGALKPVCSPNYLRIHGPFKTFEDLTRAAFLHDEVRITWANWLAERGINPSVAQSGTVFADFNLLSTAVIAGHGVALCPTDLIVEDLNAGHLVQLFDAAILHDRNYMLFHRPSRPPTVDLFCEWLISETTAPDVRL